MSDRYHATLEVELDDSVTADFDQGHALVRISREAVTNSVRHGGASGIILRLAQREGQRHLSVTDDGQGFDVAEAVERGTGYGLTSMRDRARGLPGSLEIESVRGVGSVVTVKW